MLLLTGGTGYIGSHMLLVLLEAGYEVIVLDNLSNSSRESFSRVCQLTPYSNNAQFIEGDIRDKALLNSIFGQNNIDSVLHFAGLKAVGESVEKPLKYFDNNISGSLILMQAMQSAGISKLVFSSSATVYGSPEVLPVTEQCPLVMPTNPYGYTKLTVEQMLIQWSAAHPELSIAALRYFNPIGAHSSGKIGEDPRDIPNNLMPYITQVATGKLTELSIWGNDYQTPDGTGIRDYIHVMDLVDGHLKALSYLDKHKGYHAWNLGTGQGYSVLEMVNSFIQVTGCDVPYMIKPRRAGDIDICYADATKARVDLGWQPKYDLKRMLEDSWRWQVNNPNGYEDD